MVQEMKKLVHKILETPFWPEDLQTMKEYFRTHDDCDGELGNGIVVTISTDGDVWVDTCPGGCRFRMPMTGGGLSPRVRNALLLLAVAIKLDNQEHAIPNKEIGEKAANEQQHVHPMTLRECMEAEEPKESAPET
jgi:hypothetical protein